MPYNGTESYVFVSYAHKDSDTVLPYIEAMKQNGFRVWYDRGIEAGTEWAEYIEEHLIAADSFLLFLSRAMIESQNCREEFGLARDEKKNILIVYIEDLKPSDLKHGLRLRIPSYQCLFRTRHKNDNTFIKEICDAKILQACRAATPSAKSGTTKRGTAAPAPVKREPSTGISYNPTRSESAYAVNGIGECTDTDIVIPAQYEGKSVTAVERSAFSGNTEITSVALPESINFIGRGAFYGCTALESFVLPKKVTDISIYTFYGCTSLSYVRLHKKVSNIEIGAFMECPRLTALDFEGTKAEWKRLVDACPAWDDDTAIRYVHCSDGDVEYDRGDAPVSADAEEDVEVVSSEGLAYEKIAGEQAYAVTGIGECTALDISVPEEHDGMPVTNIADNAFANQTALHTVTLPDSIVAIGSSAFSGCTALNSVIIPEQVTAIEMCTFMGCTELSMLVIEGGVKTIDVCAFSGCENLTEITFNGTKETWEEVDKNSWKWSDGSAIETVHCTDGDFIVEK